MLNDRRKSSLSPSTTARLAQDRLDDLAMYIREPKITALELECQLCMIDAHQAQDRGLEVVYTERILNYPVADLVSLTQAGSRFDSSSAQPHGEASMMVTADVRIVRSPL